MAKLARSRIVEILQLQRHPVCGFYAETSRDSSVWLPKSVLPPSCKVDRPVSTCIYFLLQSGGTSRLHRVPCAQTFHFYLGDPLTIVELDSAGGIKQTVLGNNLGAGQMLQYTVEPYIWFGSFPTNDVIAVHGGEVVKAEKRDPELHYSLVGCACSPGFQAEDFEVARRSELLSTLRLDPVAAAFVQFLTNDD